MAEAARYMFDRKFEANTRRSEPAHAAAQRERREERTHELEETRRAAFEEGREKGKAEALESLQASTHAQVGELVETARALLEAVETECEELRRSAVRIGIETANILAGELVAPAPGLNVEALFREALEYAGDAPHIALCVNDELAEGVEASVRSIAAERGFTGKIAVLGDPETKKGDCTLQWADGGVTREFEKTRAALAEIVHRHLEGRPAPETPPRQPSPANGAQAAGHVGNGADTAEPVPAPAPQTRTETVPGPAAGTGDLG